MKRRSIVAVLIILALIVVACSGTADSGSPRTRPVQGTSPEGVVGEEKDPASNLDTQTSDAGQVVVDVTPLSLDGDIWDFQVRFNTHSVNLAFDPAQISVLRCDQGLEFKPVAWEGPGPGGHHRSGILSFARPDHPISSVEIVIRGIAQVSERLFRWTIAESASPSSDLTNRVPPVAENGPPHLTLSAGAFDYGKVAMSQGAVSRELQITNTGSGVLRIGEVEPT